MQHKRHTLVQPTPYCVASTMCPLGVSDQHLGRATGHSLKHSCKPGQGITAECWNNVHLHGANQAAASPLNCLIGVQARMDWLIYDHQQARFLDKMNLSTASKASYSYTSINQPTQCWRKEQTKPNACDKQPPHNMAQLSQLCEQCIKADCRRRTHWGCCCC